MKRRGSSLANIFFKLLFYVILFFIWVGEATKKILLFPFSFPTQLLSNTIVGAFKFGHYIYKKLTRFATKARPSYYIDLFLKKKPTIDFSFVKNIFLRISLPRRKKKKSVLLLEKKVTRPKGVRIALFSLQGILLKVRYFFFGCALTLLVIFAAQSYAFVKDLPSPTNIGKVNYPLSTHMYDRDGRLLYEFYRNENRTPIALADLPPYVAEATIAIEDKDFYRHIGVSLVSGILRAGREIIFHRSLQGGSTITQQLVKSALLTPERTITRKVKEIILALWTERIYTKNQILEMYLNQVPYGGTSYGIEEASRVYFNKSAKEVTLAEAALLAGLPQAPSLYSPFVNPDLVRARRNEVLTKMHEQGYITEKQKKKAEAEEIKIIPPKTNINAPHFVFYVKSLLEQTYGIQSVEEGGLRVITTLDLDLQHEAEKILNEELEKVKNLNVGNGAVLITRPETGEILAMVGSQDYFDSPAGAFNVTTALRQPGSSIKPLMYSLALQKGFTEASIIDDNPTSFTISATEVYKPVNYDGKFHGSVPLRYALANSYNIPAVKALNAVGVENFVHYARRLGISTWTDPSRYGLSLTLGGGEVTMVDMSEAYGVLADRGYRTDPIGVLKIKDNDGNKIFEAHPAKTKVIDEGVAYIISDILSDNIARQFAFGRGSDLEIPGYKVAVKTGTTDEKKDNWTIGYTPNFMVLVWVGNNDNTPMNPYLTSGVTGASPIWNRVMSYVLKTYPDAGTWYTKPENIVEKNCYFGRPQYFILGTENTTPCRAQIFTPKPTEKKDN